MILIERGAGWLSSATIVHRCHGFIHRADTDVRCPVLLLCHRHDRRKILHVNVTRQPDASWIVLQLREAWGYEPPHRFLIFDRDAKFSAGVISTVKQNGAEPVRNAFRSPWQNGIAERWAGSVRRDLLDHVIVLNQRHLRRLLKDYVHYYNYASYCPTSLCS
jgi:putative transposase